MQEAADRVARRRRAPGFGQDIAALGVQPRAGLDGRVAPQHRRDVVALAALTPRQQVGADALAQLLVQLDLAQRAAFQRVLRRTGDLLERVGRREPVLGCEPLDLLAELAAELVVVAREQRPAIERVVLRRERVDRAAHDVRDDELAAVDGLVVVLAGELLRARRQREQRGVAGEVRGGARRRFGEAVRVAGREARAGQPEGEDLLCLHAEEGAPVAARRSAASGAQLAASTTTTTSTSAISSPAPSAGRRHCERQNSVRAGIAAVDPLRRDAIDPLVVVVHDPRSYPVAHRRARRSTARRAQRA